MDQTLLFIVIGLGPGALIAGVALGVVLTYRGAGVINFATGSVAMIGAYTYYGLHTGGYLFFSGIKLGGPWPVGAAVAGALVVSALLGVALELGVLRPLRSHSPLTKLLATLGVYLFLQALVGLAFGTNPRQQPAVLPADRVQMFGIQLRSDGLIIAGVVVLVAVALAVIYRFTRFGLATRAAAENETSAALMGINAGSLSMVNVVVASLIAGGLGVLVSPMTGLDPVTLPNVIVPALAAALLARFTSFGIAVTAGLAMGVLQSLITLGQAQAWFPKVDGQTIPGIPDVVYFVVIILALYWRGSSLPKRENLVEKRLPSVPVPISLMRPAVFVGVLAVAFFLLTPYDFRQAGINTFIGVVLALSFVLIIGYVGQSSLIQVALAGAAGFAVSKVAVYLGIGFPLGPIIGVLAAVVVGTLVAFSALRVRGVNLAIVTLAAAVAIENFVFRNPVWGGGILGSPVPTPELLGLNIGNTAPFFGITGNPSPLFGILIAAVTIGAALLVSSIRRVNLGHRFLAVRSNERAAAAVGINVRDTKLLAFALSSALAGIAGVMYAYNFGSVSAGRFSLATALMMIAFAYIAGITTVRGASIAGTMMVGAIGGFLVINNLGIPADYQGLIGGLALVLTIVFKPEGIEGGPPRALRGKTPFLWLSKGPEHFGVEPAKKEKKAQKSNPSEPDAVESEQQKVEVVR